MAGPARKRAGSSEGNLRPQILEAARRRFQRFGPRKTTMGEVAREAGCSRATVYSQFGSKEDLYASLLQADAELFIEAAEAVLAGRQGARGKLRGIVELTRATYAHNHVLRLAVTRDEEMSLDPVARAFTLKQEQRIVDLLRRVLEEGVAEGSLRAIDPERVAYLMFHLGGILVERETSGHADYPFDEIMSVMDDVFARGIGKPRSRRR